MFNARHRFHGHNALKGVYARGQSVRGPAISLKYAHRDPNRPYRVAVVVSRKVSKSAVTRNRIRRRVYAQVRQAADLIAPGTDLVFTVYGEQITIMEAPKLATQIRSLLQKVR